MLMMTTGNKALAPLLLVLLLLVLSGSAVAQNGFDLLRQDMNPRSSALASHPIAMAWGDPAAIGYNPAGLAGIDRRMVQISYADHPLDLAGGHVSYAMPYKKGIEAVSLTYFNYGEFDARPSLDVPVTNTFTPSDILLSFAHAQSVGHGFSLGAAGKILRMEIEDYSSTAIAADLGAMWREEVNDVTIAATISNIGYQVDTFNDSRENLPLTARLAYAKKLAHLPLQLNATAHYELDGDFYATGGGEFTISPELKLRAGYTTLASDYAVGGSKDSVAGISAGLGLILERFHVDYAFLSQGAIGQVHRLGLGILL